MQWSQPFAIEINMCLCFVCSMHACMHIHTYTHTYTHISTHTTHISTHTSTHPLDAAIWNWNMHVCVCVCVKPVPIFQMSNSISKDLCWMSKSQIAGLWGRFPKMNLILWGLDIMRSILKLFLSNLEDLQMWPQHWPHYILTSLTLSSSFSWASSIVQLFDFLKIDILYITGNFGHSFDILTFCLLLKPPQPSTGHFTFYFLLKPPQQSTGLFLDF